MCICIYIYIYCINIYTSIYIVFEFRITRWLARYTIKDMS